MHISSVIIMDNDLVSPFTSLLITYVTLFMYWYKPPIGFTEGGESEEEDAVAVEVEEEEAALLSKKLAAQRDDLKKAKLKQTGQITDMKLQLKKLNNEQKVSEAKGKEELRKLAQLVEEAKAKNVEDSKKQIEDAKAKNEEDLKRLAQLSRDTMAKNEEDAARYLRDMKAKIVADTTIREQELRDRIAKTEHDKQMPNQHYAPNPMANQQCPHPNPMANQQCAPNTMSHPSMITQVPGYGQHVIVCGSDSVHRNNELQVLQLQALHQHTDRQNEEQRRSTLYETVLMLGNHSNR